MNPITAVLAIACLAVGAALGAIGHIYPAVLLAVAAIIIAEMRLRFAFWSDIRPHDPSIRPALRARARRPFRGSGRTGITRGSMSKRFSMAPELRPTRACGPVEGRRTSAKLEPSRTRTSNIIAANSENVGFESPSLRQRPSANILCKPCRLPRMSDNCGRSRQKPRLPLAEPATNLAEG